MEEVLVTVARKEEDGTLTVVHKAVLPLSWDGRFDLGEASTHLPPGDYQVNALIESKP